MRALLLLLPLLAVACGAADDAATSADANLDTSGCSGLDLTIARGAVEVSAARPPTASCWNIDQSGLSLSYTWVQLNDATPARTNVGFYAALNDGDTYAKADSYGCSPIASVGPGHDTSDDRRYACTARKRLDFAHGPELLAAAYDAGGRRLPWTVQVAVSLDDDGNWDSLDGANYRFSF